MRIRRILLATDFSDCSEPAVNYATALALELGARVTIIHACEPIIAGDIYGTLEAVTLHDQVERAARRSMDALVAHLAKQGVRSSGTVEDGRAEDVILRSSRSADLVVIGTHGRGGLSHLFLGSVAERVVRAARCPVLTIRAPEKASRKRTGAASATKGARAA